MKKIALFLFLAIYYLFVIAYWVYWFAMFVLAGAISGHYFFERLGTIGGILCLPLVAIIMGTVAFVFGAPFFYFRFENKKTSAFFDKMTDENFLI